MIKISVRIKKKGHLTTYCCAEILNDTKRSTSLCAARKLKTAGKGGGGQHSTMVSKLASGPSCPRFETPAVYRLENVDRTQLGLTSALHLFYNNKEVH